MTRKRTVLGVGGLALAILLLVGLIQLAEQGNTTTAPSRLTRAQMQARLASSPTPLAALHAQASELLAGGLPAIKKSLGRLRGYPVVIDKWASWCKECLAEMGAFQRASVALGRRVAFIGIDSGDTIRSDATKLLGSLPLSYPSYYDPSGQLGEAITDSSSVPVTVFYDRRGEVQYIRQGPYPSAAKLEHDIERYALDA